MTIDDVIRDFATTGCTLPRASMQWALDHWDEAAPRFIELLDRFAAAEDRSKDNRDALFFIIHLLGGKAERASFPALCRFLHDAAATEDVLGDACTENLGQIIVSVYDGDLAMLKHVVEDVAADPFVRDAALMAMAYLAHTGRIVLPEMHSYLGYLYENLQPQAESPVWVGWAIAIGLFGFAEYTPLVESAFQRGLIDSWTMNMQDFQRDLRCVALDPTGVSGFSAERIGPFEDAIGTLSRWYYFTDKYKEDQARHAKWKAEQERRSVFHAGSTYLNPRRNTGRNDPCPCGSGRKYKKCCLAEENSAISLPAAE